MLCVGHDASRTGAPKSLLRFLRWLRANTDLTFAVLLGHGGPLEREYHQLASTRVLYPDRRPTRLWNLVHRRLAGRAVRRWNPRMIYANTTATGPILEFLSFLGVPVVTHVRELESLISDEQSIGTKRFEMVHRHSSQFIAVSEAVKSNLLENHGIGERDVEIVSGFLRTDSSDWPDRKTARQQVLTQLGLPEDVWLVGGSGTLGSRKGTDLFIQVAHKVLKAQPDRLMHFIWIGGDLDSTDYVNLRDTCEQAELSERVHFLGNRSNPMHYYAAMDVFAMVSREDPYPLVVLESAAVGVPTICFEGAGGAPEFVESDAGFVVPHLDTDAVAMRILELASNSDLRMQLGRRAREKVRARHDTEVGAPQVLKILKRYLKPE